MRASIEETRMRQAYLEGVLESAPYAIVTLDAEGIVTGWNKGAERLFGYASEEALGENVDHLVASGDPTMHKEAISFSSQVSSRLPVGPIETIRYRKDGTPLNVILSGSPVSVNEKFEGSVAVYTDITERVRVERALRESEERYRSFVLNFQGIGFRGKMDFTPIFFHGAVEKITGYTEDEFQAGKPRWDQVIHPDDLSTVFTEDEKKLVSVPNFSYEREYRIIRKDGRKRWVHEIIQNDCDDSGKPTTVHGAIYDITERKLAEEEIRRYANRIEALLEIEKAISSTLDLEEVLAIIMTKLAKVIPYDSISLQILQDYSLKILACRGFAQPDEIVGLVFPLDPKFPNQRVIEEQETLTIADITQEYPHFRSQSTEYNSGHIRSWLGVPLISKGRVKGMIAVDRSEIAPFSEIEIKTAEAIASQAALAIDNASLFREAQRRLNRLSSLRRIDDVISSNLDLRVTLNIILGQILQQLEVDAASVLLYRPGLQRLEFVAGQGFHTQALQFTNLRLGEGFAGQAALERRILQLSNLSQIHTGFLRSPEFRNEGFVAYIGTPLITKGIVTGVLEIYHRHALDPDREWISFLETLAGQTAIAIDNIRLFEGLQSSNIQLHQAYDATIEGWAQALEMRDMETEGHSRRVVETTLKLARKLDIQEEELIHIRRGALLHDIGKMSVPDTILQKPGNLNDKEWKIMWQHPDFAFELLSPIDYLRSALDMWCD